MRNLYYCFPLWLHQFTFLITLYKGSLISTTSPTFVICYLMIAILDRWEVVISVWFWCARLWWFARLNIFPCACWPSACLLSHYVPVFVPVLFCFDYCSFVLEVEVKEHDSSKLCSFSRLLFLSRVFHVSIHILKLFVLVLWKMSFVFDRGCTESGDCFE